MGEKQRFDYWVYRFDETDMRSSEQMQDAINDFALKGWRLVRRRTARRSVRLLRAAA
jgi:hypothetical protein